MAKPSAKSKSDKFRAQAMAWPDLQDLWEVIAGDTLSGWDQGKAFEHLVVRGFELSGLRVEYPYDVPPGGRPIEQIDGLVYLGESPFLIECKDKHKVDIEAIAKLHNQLLRRPPTTMGCVFTSGNFTEPALLLASYMVPYRVLLWSSFDVERAIKLQDFGCVLRQKYENLCMYGLTDDLSNYMVREVEND